MAIKTTIKGLSQIRDLIEDLSELSPDVKKVVKYGTSEAIRIAPEKHGGLKGGIRSVATSDGKTGIIRSGLPIKNPRNRPYHMWFHGYTQVKAPNGDGGYNLMKGPYAPKSGIPNYMDITFKRVNEYIDKELNTKINKL